MTPRGFTLIELLVTIAILAVITAIAVPLYTGYIQTSREGTLIYNMSTIEVFQEDQRLRTGNYLTNAADLAAITAAIGWDPQTDNVAYSIAPGTGTSYRVTATDAAGTTVCMEFPAKVNCP
jgi:type IV pilus assembly protein PilE